MSKFIIHIDDPVTDLDGLEMLRSVIVQGKISDYGKSYCYASRFSGGYMVVTRGTQPNGTTSFNIYRDATPAPIQKGKP